MFFPRVALVISLFTLILPAVAVDPRFAYADARGVAKRQFDDRSADAYEAAKRQLDDTDPLSKKRCLNGQPRCGGKHGICCPPGSVCDGTFCRRVNCGPGRHPCDDNPLQCCAL